VGRQCNFRPNRCQLLFYLQSVVVLPAVALRAGSVVGQIGYLSNFICPIQEIDKHGNLADKKRQDRDYERPGTR
jgi:hypothetical protein